MAYLVDEVRVAATAGDGASLPEYLALKIGSSNLRFIDSEAALLVQLADLLATRNGVTKGSSLALYCCLNAHSQDPEPLHEMGTSLEALTEFFLNSVSPNRALRSMPVAQVFWSAVAVGAEGPVRVFPLSKHAEQIAIRQAELDLESGACKQALVLAVSISGTGGVGKLLQKSELAT